MRDIAPLAAEKSFADLNTQEKECVLAVMTADAFDQLHRTLRSAATLDADVAPPPALAARLRHRMAEHRPAPAQKPFLQRIAHIRVPVWQAAAAVLFVLAVGQWRKTEQPVTVSPAPLVKTIVRTDTVFLEKIKWKERIVFRKSASPMPAGQESISPGFAAEIPQPAPAVNFLPTTTPEYSASGTPIGEQPELLQFFTQPGH
jgi:hypothetical protein